jgi:superfamily I DNA/RNA helicase
MRGFGSKIGVQLSGNCSDPWLEEHYATYRSPTRGDLLIQVNHCGRHRKVQLKEALKTTSLEIDYRYATWFTKTYRAWKTQEGLLDYTDLLVQYLIYGIPLNIDVMFVDEAQDLSLLQWDVVKKLGANVKRWYVAGDDDQAIFHWAGADSSTFQDLEADKTEILGQSYRVSKAVHAAALGIARRIKRRVKKEYLPTADEG